MKLDAKFYGEIRKVKNNTIVPEDQYVVFLIKDNAFWQAVQSYHSICVINGCDKEHCESVERMIERGRKWREENKHLCKWPDARGEKLNG